MTFIVFITAVTGSLIRLRRRSRHRRQNMIRRSLPDVVDLIIAALYAGMTPAASMEFVALAAPESVRINFSDIAAGLRRGERLSTLLRSLVDELGSAFRPLCDILTAADKLGIPTSSLIGQLSSDAHLMRRLQDEADARRLPVRLGLPLVLCTLPSFVVVVIVPVIAGVLSHMHITP